MNQANTIPTKTEKLFTTRSLVTMALFTAVLCISAYISIPLPTGYHITFLNFVIILILLLFPVKKSACIIGLWLIMGCIGVPVFIGGQAGVGYIIASGGGYSVAFFLCAFFIPLMRGKKYQRIRYTLVAIVSAIFVDLVGTVWIMAVTHITFPAAFVVGFIPFIALDLVKAVVAAQIVPAFQKVMQNDVESKNV